MMRIVGVLSDTHLNRLDDPFLSLFETGPFKALDTFIHAGDFTSIQVVDYLDQFVFYGVQGNMDEFDVREILPKKRVVNLDGIKIGITHGWGAPFDLTERVYDLFDDPDLDCIVFGHSHHPMNRLIGKTLMFNPGSFKRGMISAERTVGKLFLENGKIRGEIITL